MAEEFHVAVVGGGPGGSTAATMLARKGWRVVLFEREKFPREHIGESLLPASMPVLEELGVMDAVREAGFVEKRGATMVWGTGDEPWSWHFSETNTRYPNAYQVWRPTFDHILLDKARSSGVDVREEHRVLEVLFEGDRCSGLRVAVTGGDELTVGARFIVDASGQAGLIGRARKLRRSDPYFRNLAVYAYFEGARRLPPPDQGNILVESFEHGWFWGIPLSDDRMSVGAVVDSAVGQKGIAELGPEGFLRQQIGIAPHIAGMLEGATLTGSPNVIRDWSYLSDDVVGDGFILVGDAACFIDPLFSSGVHLAMSAGIMAAAYINTVFRDPLMAEPAGAVYKELYYQQYDQFRELAKLFYASNRSTESYFWEARRITHAGDSLTPREAFVRAVAGQPPRGYERVVLDRGILPPEFAEALDELETGRNERAEHFQALLAGGAEAQQRLLESRPAPARDARVERKPVLAEGEFAWGQVLSTPARPEGSPVSLLVATLFEMLDGERNVAQLLQSMHEAQGGGESIVQTTLAALQILYIDGAITGIAET